MNESKDNKALQATVGWFIVATALVLIGVWAWQTFIQNTPAWYLLAIVGAELAIGGSAIARSKKKN